MALAFVFSLLAQRVPCVGDYLDEETLNRMQQREEYLQEQMTKLLLEIEEMERAQGRMGLQALLFALLPYWKTVSVLCLFVFLFWFMWKIHKKFRGVEDDSDVESSSSEEQQQEQQELEQQEQQMQVVEVEAKDEFVFAEEFWPIHTHQEDGEQILSLLHHLIDICQHIAADTFYPVPAHTTGVGSVYEGWCPLVNEPVFCVVVSLLAPRGHTFHPDLGAPEELPARNSRVRVELECTCGREQEMRMRCFLHASAEELRNQQSNLLHSLCTDSYLDVEKTAQWFQKLIRNAWKCRHSSTMRSLNVTQSKRSCRLQVTDVYKKIFLVEMLFGVQQDDTDIFLSSQETEVGTTPSTTWPQSCAVAEAKFFLLVAARAEERNFYIRYMQVCAYILAGLNFSVYELKTVLMHLLTAIPLEGWHRSYFLERIDDLLRYLRCCVEEKHLGHFFIGNEDVPAEIILPQDFRESEPLNLFQHLEDAERHEQALQELEELQDRLMSLLIYGK